MAPTRLGATALAVGVLAVCLSMAHASDLDADGTAINFDAMIGNPLIAVMQAQMMAARETIDYITKIGFSKDERGNTVPRLATFRTESPDEDGSIIRHDLTIPILCMVPIPYMRVESVDITFKTKIASTSAFGIASSSTIEAGGGIPPMGGVPVGFSASLTVGSSISYKDTLSRSSSMSVHVHARQPDTPAAFVKIMERLNAVNRKKMQQQASS